MEILVTDADTNDRNGLIELALKLQNKFPNLKKIYADMGYTGQKLANHLQNLGIELSVIKRPKKWFWCAAGTEPPKVLIFTPLPKRWIVERIFAWIGKYRRLSKNYEYNVDSFIGMIFLALSRNLIRRMAKT